jgi:hypothetical protein
MWYEVMRYRMTGNRVYHAAYYSIFFSDTQPRPFYLQLKAQNVSPLSLTGTMGNLLSMQTVQ